VEIVRIIERVNLFLRDWQKVRKRGMKGERLRSEDLRID
jgi:hypothetical protein